jgi:acetyltransferase-like isoleucine patch superfamily enzyme
MNVRSFLRRLNFIQFEKRNKFISKDCTSEITYKGNFTVKNSVITVKNGSKLTIEDGVSIDGYNITIDCGEMVIGDSSCLLKGNQNINPIISVTNGSLIIGKNNVLKCNLLIRFGGECKIGVYNAINEETEIRCDEKIIIGDFNMISYQCMIYDTNTHEILPKETRRSMTMSTYPFIGVETNKPETKRVIIGNDNWVGKRAVILKGTNIENSVIVGTNAVVSNINVDSCLVAGNPAKIVKKL